MKITKDAKKEAYKFLIFPFFVLFVVQTKGHMIMDLATALNAEFIEEQYKRWKADPASVSSDWRFFFEGFESDYNLIYLKNNVEIKNISAVI